MNTTKTYGATGNKFGHTDQDAIERFWRHLLAGAASVRFHRPESGLGLNDKAVACIQAARKLEALIPLWSVEPANEFNTGESGPQENITGGGRVKLASPGSQNWVAAIVFP